MKIMTDISLNESVWIIYNDGKVYLGIVKNIDETKTEGTLVTVLTDHHGFRTVTASMCSRERPKAKSLFVRRSKS